MSESTENKHDELPAAVAVSRRAGVFPAREHVARGLLVGDADGNGGVPVETATDRIAGPASRCAETLDDGSLVIVDGYQVVAA